MAENEEQANLVVAAVNEATATLNEIQKQFESFEGSAQSLGVTSVALGGILKDVAMKAFEELKDMVKLGINEAIEAEQIQMKLVNSFKAEGAAAGESVAAINKMADSLGGLTGVDNDVIASSATMLRQMTGMSAEMITNLMPSISDLAIRTGSLESATMMVGRAMNGQGRGLKMLGIEYEGTGDKMKDVDTLMGKINEKFGGLAQENMKTTGGQLQELKTLFTDVAQEIGNTIIQSGLFQMALGKIKDGLNGIKEALSGNKQSSEYLQNLTASTTTAGQAYTELANSINLSDEALAKLSQGAEGFTKIKKKSAEQIALEAEQAKTIAAFNEKNDTAKRVAILENQAAATNADAVAREQRGNELIQQSELIANSAIITQLKADMAAADIEQANALKEYLAAEEMQAAITTMIANEVQQLASGIANSLASTIGQSMYNIVTQSNNSLEALKNLWHSFGNFVLRMLAEMIAKVMLFNILSSIAGMGTGGFFGFVGQMAKGLAMQTPEGSERMVPGPPNMMVPIMAHGGETVGRPSGGGSGGLTVVVQGDYFESEEGNGRLFDRLYNYQKRTGVSLGV